MTWLDTTLGGSLHVQLWFLQQQAQATSFAADMVAAEAVAVQIRLFAARTLLLSANIPVVTQP